MVMMGTLLGAVALTLTGLAIVFSIQAQKVKIRNSMDDFIDDLHRQGWWAMWATILQAVATGILIIRLLITGQV